MATPELTTGKAARDSRPGLLGTPRRTVVTTLVAASLAALLLFALLWELSGSRHAAFADMPRGVVYSIAAMAVGLAAGGLWLALDWLLLRPLAVLAGETRFLAETRAERGVPVAAYPHLKPLPDAIDGLARQLIRTRHEVNDQVAGATRRIGEQKSRLEAILRDLTEGVLVCNLDHQVLLYNQVALSLLHVSGEIGLGRSLFNLVTREPVLHALELLGGPGSGARTDEATATLVCATADSKALLSGRISLVDGPDGQPTGYVLTFVEATQEIAELSRRDSLLRAATAGLRAPIANLRAAAETMIAYPEMDVARRREFESVILREVGVLSERIEDIDREYRGLSVAHWPMADIHSIDLFKALARRLEESGGPRVTPVGMPLWLHGDSHSLVIALERVLRGLAEATAAGSFDLEALLGDRRVYVEITWEGRPVATADLEGWMDEPLPGTLGAASLRAVLARHNSEIWSRPERPGRALLRIPLPAPTRPQFAPAAPGLPPRPEFYDFDLLHYGVAVPRDRTTPLRSLAYVVFDTETTGLRPSAGDEIIAIGAVRVVNGRILTGETFSRLVNPGRPIPPESMRFHGITDAMVADAPPIGVVLPQFKAFVADSVVVAHNAAFDLKFLKMKEAETGLRFDNLPLDTLLVSAFLFEDIEDHSLDAIAERLGITIEGRHSAVGDAMATAAVFVRLLDLLEARGIRTLEGLLAASKMTLEIRAREARF